MWTTIRSSWTLFTGMIFLMISNGLLTTLLTLRAGELGFSESTIGLIQSAYPVGSLLGCLIAPRFIVQVGHIRIFAALASVASTAALIHLITNDPFSWGAMRLLCGFCFSGLYVIAESWLNGSTDNLNRGSLLSIYFIIQTGGVMIGQLLLNLSSPEGILLFIVASILISLSLVPMLISTKSNPNYELPERISLTELFRLSPMGITGSFLNGISQSVLYIGLALYGKAIGLSNAYIGGLIAFMTLGGMLFQFPLGKLSDRIDRRLVLVGTPILAIVICLLLAMLDNPANNIIQLFTLVTFLGGLTLPLYSICMAHMNDYLKPGQTIAASGTLVLVLAIGMIFGSILGGQAISHYGPQGLFHLLSVISILTVMTAFLRLRSGRHKPESPTTVVAMSAHVTPEVTQIYSDASNQNNDNVS